MIPIFFDTLLFIELMTEVFHVGFSSIIVPRNLHSHNNFWRLLIFPCTTCTIIGLCIIFLKETWRSCVYFIAPNKLEDNVFIDILSEVVASGLRKLFSIITYEDLVKDVSSLRILIINRILVIKVPITPKTFLAGLNLWISQNEAEIFWFG